MSNNRRDLRSVSGLLTWPYSNVEVRWHGEPGKDVSQMIISNAVIMDHPFEAANCRAATNKQDVLKRTKQIVEDQRKKLGLSGGIRKGG